MTGSEQSVLHVAWGGGLGGTERHVSWIVEEARREGLDHRACFFGPAGAISRQLAARGLAVAIGARSGYDLRAIVRLGRLLLRIRPSVIHLHTSNFAVNSVTRCLCPRSRIVYTEHSPAALVGSWRYRVFYAVFRRVTSEFVAIAPAMATCMRRYGVADERIASAPHAIATPVRPDGPSQPTGWHIGVVARLERQKRVDVLLDVVVELRRRGRPVQATIVGDGSQRKALEEQARSLAIDDAIDFVGSTADVVPWLDRMDLFLMTSEAEPLGLTALEAMARGVPVVALPCPGGLEDIVAGVGIVAPTREIGDAVDVVDAVLSDRATWARMRRGGLALAQERTVRSLLARLHAIYRGSTSTTGKC